jgi:hypothetical protein
MTFSVGDPVERIERRPQVAAVVFEISEGGEGELLQLAYEEGGAGWWPASCVKRNEAP